MLSLRDLSGYFAEKSNLHVGEFPGVTYRRPPNAIGGVEINSPHRADAHVYITRDQARDLVHKLQKMLTEAGDPPVEQIVQGDEILATTAEQLPVGSRVLHRGNGTTYTVSTPDAEGNMLAFPDPEGGDLRMAGKRGVKVVVTYVAPKPEPIVEPECDYVIDSEGDFWVKHEIGWAYAQDLDTARKRAERKHVTVCDFDTIVTQFGPLAPYREVLQVEELAIVQKVAS